MAQTEATNVSETAAAAPPAPTGDPAILGLPSFIAGAVCLGVTFLGKAPLGGAAPIILFATAVGLLIATIWAARLGASAVAGIFGVFTGFWFSYGMLVTSLGHNWFGLAAGKDDVKNTVIMFAAAWLVVIVALTVATLALPAAFTLLFVLVDLALALVWASFASSDGTTLLHAAGWAVLAFTAVGVYLWIGSLLAATGKKGLPLGPAVLK